MNKIKNRESNIDLLRILSTLAVILIHVNWKFFKPISTYPTQNLHYILGSFVNIFTRFSVPCFVMISGAFLLKNKNNRYFLNFYKKSISKIFAPAFFLQVIFALILIAESFLKKSSIVQELKGLLTGGIYAYWYMYMLAGLYILVPLVIRIKESMTNKQYTTMGIVLLVWAAISQATTKERLAYSIGVVFAFGGYLIIGDIIHNCCMVSGGINEINL